MNKLPMKLVQALEERYGQYWWPEDMYPEDMDKEPFKNMIVTILSQNTTETNCIRAYRGLVSRFDVTPESLYRADEAELREAIRSGGLYNVKARRIKQLSKAVLEEYSGDISRLSSRCRKTRRRRS